MLDEKLNICYVSQEYPPETGWGGIGTYVYEISHALVERGHKVVVLSRALDEERCYDDKGVLVYRILPKCKVDTIPFFWRFNRVWEGYLLAVALNLKKIIKKHKIDLIEAPDCRAETLLFQLLVRRRPPVVIKLHGGMFTLFHVGVPRTLKNRWKYLLQYYAVRTADFLTSPSQGMVEMLRQKNIKFLHRKNITVIHNPLDARKIGSLASQGDNTQRSILFVGRNEYRKGPHILIEAIPKVLEEVPDVTFIFLGGGFTKESFLQMVPSQLRSGAPHVFFFAHKSREEVYEYYKKATVCVFPSIWENFPYTCLEAMAWAKPIVASQAGGISEMIEDRKSGILIKPKDSRGLAESLIELLKSKDLRGRLGREARERTTKVFSAENIVENTLETYRKIVG